MAKHGETRIHGMTRQEGEHVEFELPAGGTVSLPVCSVEETAAETWCDHCGRWIQTNGVLGPLTFMALHRDGDCRKAS